MENEIQIDLPFIQTQANENSEKYKALKKKILAIPEKEFDALILPIAERITTQVDCTKCGNCCRQLNPPVREDEILQLAEKKGCSSREFATQFLHQNPKQDYFFLKQKPCIFLAETRCTIYESRPDSCADYPHLQSPGQKFRFGRTIEQAGTCSIVFHVLEEIYEKLI